MQEPAEADAKLSFERGLLQPLRRRLEPLLDPLRAPNMELLVKAIASGLAAQIEVSVMRKAFNESGAMLLCEHTRKLTDCLSELVSGSVRNELSRLNQISCGARHPICALLAASSLLSAFRLLAAFRLLSAFRLLACHQQLACRLPLACLPPAARLPLAACLPHCHADAPRV